MTVAAVEPPQRPLRRMLVLARPMRASLVVSVLSGAATVACAVALLSVSGWLIARASEHPNEVALAVAVVGVRAFGIGRGVFRYVERLSSHDAAFRVLADLRVRVYQRLELLAPAGLGRARAGDLLARLVSDVDAVQELFIRGITPQAVAALVGASVVSAVALMLAPAAGVVAVALLIAGVAVPWLTDRLARLAVAGQASDRAGLSTRFTDLVAGSADIAAYGREADMVQHFAAVDDDATRRARRAAAASAVGTGLSTLVTGFAVWLVLLLAVAANGGGHLSRVTLAAVVLTTLAAFEATNPLAASAQQVAAGRVGARRVLEVLDQPLPVRDAATPVALPDGPLHIELLGVRVRYSTDRPWALDGVNLDIAPGRRVALIGPSGSGKSTLLNVLLRFRDVDSGAVLVNGQPLAEFAADDVRRRVSGCLADAHIFDSTVRENVRLARPGATQEELDAVARRVRLLDWIHAQPQGWDTPVGPHGQALSGGQRQRLALARALLADPEVLVLDEPAAHLDPDTRAALMADVVRATVGRTVVLVTHDRSGLDAFDEVVTLNAGRVVDRRRRRQRRS